MSKSNFVPEAKEKYFVQASLNIAGKELNEIPCKIYFPSSTLEKPYFRFRPSTIQYEILSRVTKTSFFASLNTFDYKVEVESPVIYLSDKSRVDWGTSISEASLKGEPQNLKVIETFKKTNEDKSKKAYLTIWISPNSLLEPDIDVIGSYLGDAQYIRNNQLSFDVNHNFKISFDKHFDVTVYKNKELRQSPFLVGCAEIDPSLFEEDKFENHYLPLLDNIFYIASLGARIRTACLGWEASLDDRVIKFYKCNFRFPSGKSEFLINSAFPEDFKDSNHTESLIGKDDFEEYLHICVPSLLEHPNSKVLNSAIISLVPGKRRSITEAFLSIFSSLEAILLDFKKKKHLEYVINDRDEWKARKQEIKESIKKIMSDYSGAQRSYVYRKLEELNRISLKDVFYEFCDDHKLYVSDLWPLFKSNGIVGLTEIRNKLVHGDIISNKYIKMLSEAQSSLQYMLERILLTILGYPVHKSDVSRQSLKSDPYRLNWTREEQLEFSSYIENM